MGIGIQEPLPQNVAVLRGDEEIIAAIGNQHGDFDLIEAIIRALIAMLFGEEALHGGDLVLDSFWAKQPGAVLARADHALPPLLPDLLFLVRVREERPLESLAPLLLGSAAGHLRGVLRVGAEHSLARTGHGAGDDELPH